MGNRRRLAAGMAAMLTMSALAGQSAIAGENAVSIDMTTVGDEAWAGIAMANDDTVTTGAVIRTSAAETSKAVGFLYRGGAVKVMDRGEEWTEISSGKISGYIKNEYLTYGTEAKGLAEYYGEYGARASWDDVNVFAEENGDAQIIQSAKEGEIFRVAGKNGAWMQLKAGSDDNAYVPAEDVDLVIVLDGAVAVDEDKAADEGVFTTIECAENSEAEAEEIQVSEGSAQTYEEPEQAYEEPAQTFTEPEQTYEEPTQTYTEPEQTYEAPAQTYTEPEQTGEAPVQTSEEPTSYSYTPTYDGSGTLQEQANALYADYLSAQAQADAAVANGAGETIILQTAEAAQSAYAVFLKKQNEADAAAAGTAETGSAENGSAENTYTETTTDTITDTTTYEEPVYEQTETAEAETEAAPQASSSDLELLAALIYCEAGNQPYDGQVAVGAVVMNRIASSSFPGSVTDVINQAGQFTPSYSGALANAIANGSGANYIGAASDAMAGTDPTGGALYFNTHQGSGKKIGDHWFF